jgi:hypothetical protein
VNLGGNGKVSEHGHDRGGDAVLDFVVDGAQGIHRFFFFLSADRKLAHEC